MERFNAYLSINHLYEVSKNIPNDLRNEDGVHYLYGGYQILAKEVVSALEILNL